MRSTVVLASLALLSCAGHQRIDAPEPAPRPAPAPSTVGTDAPWPEPSARPAPELRTDSRPLPHDMAQLRWLREVRIAPDGSRVAYTVRAPRFDPEAKPSAEDTDGGWTVETQLYVVGRDGGAPRQLTFGDEAVSSPRWSPEGDRLAFVREHEGAPAIHVLPLGGGEARVVDTGERAPTAIEWAPDGEAIAFTAERPRTDEETEAEWKRGGAYEYDRHWRQKHLFVVPAAGGEVRHVNRGTDTVAGFAWSPDGEHLALVTAASSDPYEVMMRKRLVVISSADGEVVETVVDEPQNLGHLAWSPDGQQLAFEAMNEGLTPFDRVRVHRLGGDTIELGTDLDPTLQGFVWAAGGRAIVAHVVERTRSRLIRLPVDGSDPRPIGLDVDVLRGGLHASRDGRHVAVRASGPTEPTAPALVDLRRRTVHRVASINPQIADWDLGTVELARWKNPEGQAIEGLLTRTPHAEPGEPAPLLVLPHGGPDSVSRNGFHAWAHFFAARGYHVLRPNYRGGTGYGFEFYAANRGRLGAIEQADIESGVDHLIETGVADPDRLFFGGWSWGGYLATWTLTTTDRYRAIVVGAGVVDVVVQYVTSDINHGIVGDWEYRGRPWTEPDAFADSNPIERIADASTPTLILHGEEDARVPFVNALTLYRALRDLDVETRFFAYPREPHGIGEPAHIEHLFRHWAAWYDAHLPSATVAD